MNAIERLNERGYCFNKGILCLIDENTRHPSKVLFQLYVTDSTAESQDNLEEVHVLRNFPAVIYDLFERAGLSRIQIPNKSSFFFTWPKVLNKPKRLLVLIHGCGIANIKGQQMYTYHSTQLPYVKKAKLLDYDIVLTNTNTCQVFDGQSEQDYASAFRHAVSIWEQYVMACEPESVAIVAHIFGGNIALQLAKKFPDFFEKKVFAIALIDSQHLEGRAHKLDKHIWDKTCNWVSSKETKNSVIQSNTNIIKTLSAGSKMHEFASYLATNSIFGYLERHYKSKCTKNVAVEKLRNCGCQFNLEGVLCRSEIFDSPTTEPLTVIRRPLNWEILKYNRRLIREVVRELFKHNDVVCSYIIEHKGPSLYFMYPNVLRKPKKLIVLIHGSGIDIGGIDQPYIYYSTQLPYVVKAQMLNYNIIITNTNGNTFDGKQFRPGSDEAVAINIWEHYIMGCGPKSVAVVAHSSGADVAFSLAKNFPDFFKRKVFAIALTDAGYSRLSKPLLKLIRHKTCNWVPNEKPVGTTIKEAADDCIKEVSSGHRLCEYAPSSAKNSIFTYLNEKYNEFISVVPPILPSTLANKIEKLIKMRKRLIKIAKKIKNQ